VGGLEGEIQVFQPMLIRDISCLGVTIETAALLQLDSLHELRLTIGERSVVVNQDVVTYRAGLEFVEPSERTAQAIAAFVDQLKEPGRP
jgi:hypothetical protein